MYKILNRTLVFSLLLTFIVIVMGAFTRLKDAGLGCPDWPGCYGQLFAPSVGGNFDITAVLKAWIEMIHRYIAGTLGLLILFIAWRSIKLRSQMPKLWIWTSTLVGLVIFQALLGMWTVTMLLNPVIVMSHLLGGIAIFSVLWWVYLQCSNLPHTSSSPQFRLLVNLCILTLVTQIALGGWTSANYAALVCADFPTCQGHWWPTMDWQNAFALPGIPLENNARVTIQMAHRIGALITTIICSILIVKCWQKNYILKIMSAILGTLLVTQITLGISNVLGGLPLWVSLMHSAVAVMLLLCLLAIRYIVHGNRRKS